MRLELFRQEEGEDVKKFCLLSKPVVMELQDGSMVKPEISTDTLQKQRKGSCWKSNNQDVPSKASKPYGRNSHLGKSSLAWVLLRTLES